MPNTYQDIEQRVAVSLALGRYLRAADRFAQASDEFIQSCEALRKQLSERSRFVLQIDFKHYLVTSDGDGNFDVEQIESL